MVMLTVNVSATGEMPNLDEKGSLTLTMHYNGQPLNSGKVNILALGEVAEVSENVYDFKLFASLGKTTLTQKELYELTKAGGGIMVQAHPFRNGTTVLDPDYLDGVEINCHPLYKKSYAQELIDIAEKEHLLLTCGGDYHADTYRPKCGMILPDELVDHKDLCRYLSTPGEKSILMQEVNASECESIQYSR